MNPPDLPAKPRGCIFITMDNGRENLSEQSKPDRVRSMFAEIAHRYDLLNHALSLNIDRRWRRFTVGKLAEVLRHPGARALDLCCGTADLALELGSLAPTWGIDFCHPMLKLGLKKVQASGLPILLAEADALRVPFAGESFEAVTMAFGLRNLEAIDRGLMEIHRVLKKGGRAAILEFSKPQVPVVRHVFQFYFTRILPVIGSAVSGSRFAYRYLPDSVKEFPDQDALAMMMRAVGFSRVEYYNLSGGVAALHLGDKV